VGAGPTADGFGGGTRPSLAQAAWPLAQGPWRKALGPKVLGPWPKALGPTQIPSPRPQFQGTKARPKARARRGALTSGSISGTGLAQAKTTGSRAIVSSISGVRRLPALRPRNTSAPSTACGVWGGGLGRFGGCLGGNACVPVAFGRVQFRFPGAVWAAVPKASKPSTSGPAPAPPGPSADPAPPHPPGAPP
jgi:hypothetical protein